MNALLKISLILGFAILPCQFPYAQNTAYSLFLKKDSLQVKEIRAEQGNGVLYGFVGHLGPAVENTHGIFRLYFNDSGAIDVYSKSGKQSELLEYSWHPDEKERSENGAGEDAYNVGRSLGLGGIALWDGEKIVRLKATRGRSAKVGEIIRNRKVKGAFAEIIAYGVPCGEQFHDISIRIECPDRGRKAKVIAKELNGHKLNFVTGIRCPDGAQEKTGRNYIAVWSKDLNESESCTEVGTALIYKASQFLSKPAYDGQMYYLISKRRKNISTEILSASNLEDELKNFEAMLEYIR